MIYNKQILLLLIGILVISAVPVGLISAQETEQPEPISSGIQSTSSIPTFGMQTHHITDFSLLDSAKAAGNYWIRYNGLLWSEVQPNNKNDSNWNPNLDNFLKEANQRGMEVILIIRGTPEWAQKYAPYSCGPIREDKFNDFANFIQEVVNIYSEPPYNVTYFEIWNEPDDGRATPRNPKDPNDPAYHRQFGCWAEDNDPYGGGEYYGKMLKAIYPVFKNSSAQLVLGGLLLPCDPRFPDSTWPASCPTDPNWVHLTNRARFFEGILKECGTTSCFDVVNFHGFNFYQIGLSPIQSERSTQFWGASGGSVVGKLDYLRDMMTTYGVDQKPVLLTEAGLIDYDDYSLKPSFNRQAFEEAKADYVLWLYTRNIALDVMGTTWYHFRIGWKLSGLIDHNNRPLPAYRAYQVMTTTLGGAEYNRKLELGSGILGYEFRKGGRTIWVLFSEDGSTKTINKSVFPYTIRHVYNLMGGEVTQTDTTIQFNRPIYIDNIHKTQPKFISVPITEVNQHQFYYYYVETASEAPAHFDVHTITPIEIPSWLTLIDKGDGTATLSGTPVNEQLVNKYHDVSIRVTDSQGKTATQSFSIWVNNVNDPPRFISRPVTKAEPGELYVYEIQATDPDYIHGEEDLTITVRDPKPAWLEFVSIPYDGSGIWRAQLSGTPTQAQIDEKPMVRLRVTDKAGLFAEQTFIIGAKSIFLPLIVR